MDIGMLIGGLAKSVLGVGYLDIQVFSKTLPT